MFLCSFINFNTMSYNKYDDILALKIIMPDILLSDIWIYENKDRDKKLNVVLNAWLVTSGAKRLQRN